QRLGFISNHAMAVVVQRVVQPDFAGVLFTADPISGSHTHMTGNYVHGLGEQLVSGEANAQDFQITRSGEKYHGPAEFRKHARKLFPLAIKLEKDFGCALDIEWAVANGQVYLLQSRPVTTLRTIHYETYEVNESLDHEYMWTNNNIGEALPDVMTPFTWSLIRELDEETQKISGYYLWSGNICGRTYTNISLVFSFMGKFGIPLDFSKKLIGNVLGMFPANVEMPIYPFGTIELLKDVSWRGKRNLQRRRESRKYKDRYLRQTQPWCEANIRAIQAAEDPQQLLRLWTGEIRPYVSKMWAIFVGASDTTLITLLDRLTKLVGVEDANALLSNIRGENGLESLGPLVGISKVVKGELSQQEYLAKYGHRSPHEFEMSFPYPAEDPDYMDKQIAEYQQSGTDVERMLARQHEQYTQAKSRFIQRYPAKRKWLENNLEKMGQAGQTRELLRSEFTRTFRVMRVFVLKVGEITGIGADAFFLYSFEFPRVLQADSDNHGLLAQLPARKRNYERYCSLPPLPMFIKGLFDPFEWAKNDQRRLDYYDADAKTAGAADNIDQNPRIIQGFAGAAGTVEGTVRVL
ncbi:MAG: phosphoenolpyruvate synthase, partial [Chloroflexi bacterium]